MMDFANGMPIDDCTADDVKLTENTVLEDDVI